MLILTTFAQDEHLFEALRAGARGYLLKDAGAGRAGGGDQDGPPGRLAGPAGDGLAAARPVRGAGDAGAAAGAADRARGRGACGWRPLGRATREIAERLVVSEKTVKYHLGQAYAKLAVTGRAEAVARARELGLLPLDTLSPA